MGGIVCERCHGTDYVKRGTVRNLQRYQCKACGCNFTDTPPRGKPPAMKALALMLYAMGNMSFCSIARLLGVSDVAVLKWVLNQGCSTLLTDSQREYCVETTECGGVSVLIECIVLIASENVVSEAAHAGEDAGVVADARAVFEKGDIARVMQLVFDVPVAADGSGKAACRSLGVSQVVGDLAG